MKKLFISLLAIAATINAMAIDYTAKAKITLNSQNGESCYFTVGASADATISQYNAPMNMTNRVVAMYAISGAEKYQLFYAADLEGLALGLMTNAETNYTVNFSNVIGTLYLIDAVANKSILITEGGSYAFTAEANQTIADRFSIAKNIPAKFINNQLVINDAAADAEVNVTPFSFVEGRRVDGQKVTYNAPVNQALNGNYFEVEYTNKNGVARKFIVNANPTVLPANN